MSSSIVFRRLDVDDLQQVFLWLIRPHVSKWYAPAPSSFAEVVAKYGPRTQEGNAVHAYMIEVDGAPAGYIQSYDLAIFPDYAASLGCESGVAGIDLFIGEEAVLNRGLGAEAARRFVEERVFAAGAHACVAGPDEGDRASIRAFEKAGFRRWRTLRVDDGRSECVLRRERDAHARHLAPIDLERDFETCVRFRRDSYVVSFGSEAGLDAEMGADNALYLAKTRARIAEVPEGNAHLWHDGRIVGQTEMRHSADDPGIGYVNLFYIVPELRGQGLGRFLHEHAAGVFRARGKRAMRLSVSEKNAAAIAFYTKLGWVRVGTREHHATMQVMEFPLA